MNDKPIELNLDLINANDSDSIYVTAKDYFTEKGVVTRLNNKPIEGQPNWFVKGPMGMGLSLDKNGHNVAFTGGTGILVFLDVVGMILL